MDRYLLYLWEDGANSVEEVFRKRYDDLKLSEGVEFEKKLHLFNEMIYDKRLTEKMMTVSIANPSVYTAFQKDLQRAFDGLVSAGKIPIDANVNTNSVCLKFYFIVARKWFDPNNELGKDLGKNLLTPEQLNNEIQDCKTIEEGFKQLTLSGIETTNADPPLDKILYQDDANINEAKVDKFFKENRVRGKKGRDKKKHLTRKERRVFQLNNAL